MLGAGPTVEEEPFELDEAGVDDERLPFVERQPRLREAERVGDREAHGGEAMAASRHVVKAVRAPVATRAVWPQLDLPLPEPPDAVVDDDVRQRHPGLALELDLDPDVVPLEQVLVPPDHVLLPPAPGHVRVPQRDAHPGDRERHDEHEPGGDRIERRRAEDDGNDPAEDAEREYRSPPGGHQTGTGVCASASATSSAWPSPAERASGARISRCASTGTATAFTSSGLT